MHNFFFFDTETTWKDSERASVVEIALHYSDAGCKMNLEERCKPTQPIDVWAMATHHITPAMVADKPPFKDTECVKFLRNNPDLIAITHNAPYDIQVLKNEGIEIKEYIDTLQVARHLCQDDNLEGYSLQYLRYFYELDKYNENNELPATMAHSALYDAICIKWLFTFLYNRLRKLHPGIDTLQEMIHLSKQAVILKSINFGKHKGRSFAWLRENAWGYLNWLFENSDDRDILATCNYYLNADINARRWQSTF